jgi:hypothetical protein
MLIFRLILIDLQDFLKCIGATIKAFGRCDGCAFCSFKGQRSHLLLDKIVNLVGLLVFWFSVPLLLDDDCESCWFTVVLFLCSSAFR